MFTYNVDASWRTPSGRLGRKFFDVQAEDMERAMTAASAKIGKRDRRSISVWLQQGVLVQRPQPQSAADVPSFCRVAVHTEHFLFEAVGRDQADAEAGLAYGLERHRQQYAIPDPDWHLPYERVVTFIARFGCLRDGQPL